MNLDENGDRSKATDLNPFLIESGFSRGGLPLRLCSPISPVEAASEASSEWSDILDAIPDAISTVDLDGRILLSNKAVGELLGMNPEEVTDRYCCHLLHGTDQPPPDCSRLCMQQTGECAENVFQYGNRWLRCGVQPRRDAVGRIIGAVRILSDITARRELEAQLVQSQKMETVGNLASGIAHDFNNILTAIMSNLSLTRECQPSGDPGKIYLDEISQLIERAAHLTSQLLSFSRCQTLNPVQADLNEVVSSTGRMLKQVLGEHIVLDLRPAPAPVVALVDVMQIGQVLLNLAINARDAMSRGGRLTIEVRSLDLTEYHINPAIEIPPGRYAYIEVTDMGGGMDEVTLQHIFEPFFTTKEPGKGTGLGLSMVYSIVKQHRGYVLSYSEKGCGTSFKIYLPLSAETVMETVPMAVMASVGDVDAGHETILLVEDEVSVVKAVARILERRGYTVMVARDGVEGVETYGREKEKIDLVILDSVMPRMGGKEAAERIREMDPRQKMIFTSGYSADSGFHDDYISPSDVNFIQKPYSAPDLMQLIRHVLDGDNGSEI